jgi:hypothetical protein
MDVIVKRHKAGSIAMRRFLMWAFPDLSDELKALREANSKIVIENSRLHDEILILHSVDMVSIKRLARVDGAIARQLQRSLEENGRLRKELAGKVQGEC